MSDPVDESVLRELDTRQRARLLKLLPALDPAPTRAEYPRERAARVWAKVRAQRPADAPDTLLAAFEAEVERQAARRRPPGPELSLGWLVERDDDGLTPLDLVLATLDLAAELAGGHDD